MTESITNEDTADKLVGYLQDAARQRRRMESWADDRRFETEGGIVIHSVDTDIIKLYTDPSEVSVPFESREVGYAQVFRTNINNQADALNLMISLGWTLAEHIFYALQPSKLPRLVISPLDRELGRVFAAVVRNVGVTEQTAEQELNKLKEKFETLKALEHNKEALVEELTKMAPTIAITIHAQKGPAFEMGRFKILFSEARVASADYIIDPSNKYKLDDEVRRVLTPLSEISNYYEYNRLREAWEKRLQTNPEHRIRPKDKDDAAVLARLEWMNQHLNGDKFRIVHITGSKTILKAARKYTPKGSTESFAARFLRHPTAFIGSALSPKMAADDKLSRHELIDMLDVFLVNLLPNSEKGAARWDEIIERDQSTLVNEVNPVLIENPQIVSDFLSKWDGYIRYTIPQRLNVLQHTKTMTNIVNELQHISTIINHIETLLIEKSKKAWDDCFVAITRAGADILFFQSPGGSKRPRNPPALYFDKFPKAMDFMKTILTQPATSKINSDDYNKKLKEMKDEDDGFGYIYYLTYAFFFAAAGRWLVTEILADRALRIVEAGVSSGSLTHSDNISGREAAFLKAVAVRHSARSFNDLDSAKQMLLKARNFYEKEQSSKSPEADKVGCPIRFDTEENSRKLCCALFKIFGSNNKDSSDNEDNNPCSLADIQKKSSELLDHLLMNHPHNTDNMKCPWVFVIVERKLFTNLYMAALLRAFPAGDVLSTNDDKNKIREEVHNYYKLFSDNVNSQQAPMIDVSFRVQSVYNVATWWIRGTRDARDMAVQKLADQDIEAALVMPYDRDRYRHLRNIVQS